MIKFIQQISILYFSVITDENNFIRNLLFDGCRFLVIGKKIDEAGNMSP